MRSALDINMIRRGCEAREAHVKKSEIYKQQEICVSTCKLYVSRSLNFS
jgi:hypothetical protein